jgi:hypothetical protein
MGHPYLFPHLHLRLHPRRQPSLRLRRSGVRPNPSNPSNPPNPSKLPNPPNPPKRRKLLSPLKLPSLPSPLNKLPKLHNLLAHARRLLPKHLRRCSRPRPRKSMPRPPLRLMPLLRKCLPSSSRGYKLRSRLTFTTMSGARLGLL